jgi:hypothetical protein
MYLRLKRSFLVFRIRWINAKAALDRAKEELIILKAEMVMCYLGYQSNSREWNCRGQTMAHSPGHVAIAAQKAAMWDGFAKRAKTVFNEVVTGHSVIP